MATSGKANMLLAEAFGVKATTVKHIGLLFISHGLRPKMPPGLASAQLTPMDLALYVIALNFNLAPSEAPRVVKSVRDAKLADVSVWQVTSEGSKMEPAEPIADFPGSVLLKNAGTENIIDAIHRSRAKDLPKHLPVEETFGETFAQLLEKLSEQERPDYDHLEIAMSPLALNAVIKITLGKEVFSVLFGAPSYSDRFAVYGMRGEFLIRLARILRA